MSRLLSEEEYRHTRAFKIKRWYHGEKDPYIGSVEMKPQKPFKEDIAVQKKRIHDEAFLKRNIYDIEHNRKLQFFQKFYKVVSILFVFLLIGILLYMVSYLPPVGNAANPDNKYPGCLTGNSWSFPTENQSQICSLPYSFPHVTADPPAWDLLCILPAQSLPPLPPRTQWLSEPLPL